MSCATITTVLCSVCILLEICALGSLTDVLRGKKEKNNTQIHSTTDLAQLKLCFADLVYLAIGCARYSM